MRTDCMTSKCSCFTQNSECDPDLCPNCFFTSCSMKKGKCKNNAILLNLQKVFKKKKIKFFFDFSKKSKRTAIGNSKKPGYGLYTIEPIKKDEYIISYLGEVFFFRN